MLEWEGVEVELLYVKFVEVFGPGGRSWVSGWCCGGVDIEVIE